MPAHRSRRRVESFLILLILGVVLFSGCGGGVPEGQATPNAEMNVDESGSPPEGKAKPIKKR